jgi:hypothetical protein
VDAIPALFGLCRMLIGERANGGFLFISSLQIAFDERGVEPGRALKGQPFKDGVALGRVFPLHGVGDLRRIFIINQRLKRASQGRVAFAYRKFRVLDFFVEAVGSRGFRGRSV